MSPGRRGGVSRHPGQVGRAVAAVDDGETRRRERGARRILHRFE